jgi:hypothetical protein
MTRAPRDPAKLAVSKARREAMDASFVMPTKVTPLLVYEYRDMKVEAIVKATKYDWPNGTTTFTLETKNTTPGALHPHGSEPYQNEAQLMEHATYLDMVYRKDVDAYLKAANA